MKDMNSFWFLFVLVAYGVPILLIFGAGYWLGGRKWRQYCAVKAAEYHDMNDYCAPWLRDKL